MIAVKCQCGSIEIIVNSELQEKAAEHIIKMISEFTILLQILCCGCSNISVELK